MQGWCVAAAGEQNGLERRDEFASLRQTVKRGERLYRTGESFRSLYAISSGSFKTSRVSHNGAERVAGFFLAGDLLGVDAIGTDAFNFDAVALEDSRVCVLPFSNLETFTRKFPALQHQLHKLISREISRDRGLNHASKSSAAERVAAFLLWLSARQSERGFSATHFVLRMKRGDIGNYLGLTPETVTRTLTRFDRERLIRASHRNIALIDLGALERIASAA